MAHEGIPLPIVQRQLGIPDLGLTHTFPALSPANHRTIEPRPHGRRDSRTNKNGRPGLNRTAATTNALAPTLGEPTRGQRCQEGTPCTHWLRSVEYSCVIQRTRKTTLHQHCMLISTSVAMACVTERDRRISLPWTTTRSTTSSGVARVESATVIGVLAEAEHRAHRHHLGGVLLSCGDVCGPGFAPVCFTLSRPVAGDGGHILCRRIGGRACYGGRLWSSSS
jgi:hypothetical protein